MKKSYSHGADLAERGYKGASVGHLLSNDGTYMSELFSHNHKAWNMSDSQIPPHQRPRLPLKSFNHISKEVINLEKSKNFYCDLLGFVVVPRPPFEANGYWLWGYNLSLHLVLTSDKRKRKSVLKARYAHFTEALPRVDHFAFMTDDVSYVKEILDQANVYYKHEKPAGTGIEQLFFFDPDGNVIEVSTCTAMSIDGINWCHTLPPDESASQCLINQTIAAVDAIQYCDVDSHVRGVVEFSFSDGTREQVVVAAVSIGEKTDYVYDDSDFLSHRGSDDSTSISNPNSPQSSHRSLEVPSVDAVCV
jgi:catechol 2,3-dioxygenase-like lactoylglutathione lyase family enzyme